MSVSRTTITPSMQALRVLQRLAFPPSSVSRPALSCHPHNGSRKATHTARHFHATPTAHSSSSRPLPTPTPSPSRPPINRCQRNPYAPSLTRSRGPASTESTALSDFSSLDIFSSSSTPPPAISVDATLHDGFHLSNGLKTGGLTAKERVGKEESPGLMLLGGEAFLWRPWTASEAGTGGGGRV
ncbi:uncharacterized protein AB675_3904 [Cyphellophora attinorum]|uniref:Uncharacterized protein n=1 Tax=Cyphellophora attinorum TaxID=1664694 RepID=A0A0N1H0Q6_9EURO|nr:uncharacterized protein AB675_3904 [Phialophora attinorum]KPI37577.1 hypothetical protein AB675_3904 [Phialophora attinorum]